MKVAAMVGSVRQQSYNRRLVEFMQKRYKDQMEIQILPIQDLPFFNQDVENDPPQTVRDFKKAIADADAVIIATPEYNHSIPGILKNALDWLSRVDKVMTGKRVQMVGAATGIFGTVRAQMHLRQILASPGFLAQTMIGNDVLIPSAADKFNAEGKLVHEQTIAILDKTVEQFMQAVKKA